MYDLHCDQIVRGAKVSSDCDVGFVFKKILDIAVIPQSSRVLVVLAVYLNK